jgi:hypothetical protein
MKNVFTVGLWWQYRWSLSVQAGQLQLDAGSSMHFWIDKRSQTCGFSGRHRMPALSAGSFGQQHRRQRRTSRGKPMVTPVHRFQPIESVAGGGGGFGGQHGPRRFQQHHLQPHHHNHRQHQSYFPSNYRYLQLSNLLNNLYHSYLNINSAGECRLSRMWRRVPLVITYVSEERIASIIRVERIIELRKS